MKTIKRVFRNLLYLCIMAVNSVSCSDNDEFAASKTQIEGINKNAILAFSNKEDIIQAVNDGEISTRAKTMNLNPNMKMTTESPKILSLTDKVQANDPILNEVSEEEKQIILSEGMTYYDMFGCEDYIPSPNFAKLLNSNREIQLKDSVYKITEFGTLRANQVDRKNLIWHTIH